VLTTADSDFAAMLALGGSRVPSVLLVRSADHTRPPEQADLHVAILPAVTEGLERGAIVSLNRRYLRIRELPIQRRV
jgi:predicted nuclease of predicted toxin-antitoxin system